jgi:ribosome production factor 2
LTNRKPKTHRGKRELLKREPKIIENAKKAIMLRGVTASNVSMKFVKDIVS